MCYGDLNRAIHWLKSLTVQSMYVCVCVCVCTSVKINCHNQYSNEFSSIFNILLILTNFTNYILKFFHCIILAEYTAILL